MLYLIFGWCQILWVLLWLMSPHQIVFPSHQFCNSFLPLQQFIFRWCSSCLPVLYSNRVIKLTPCYCQTRRSIRLHYSTIAISGDSPSPPQSILQAVAFKAIPCVEAQVSPPWFSSCGEIAANCNTVPQIRSVSEGGRSSPTDSIEYSVTREEKQVINKAIRLFQSFYEF